MRNLLKCCDFVDLCLPTQAEETNSQILIFDFAKRTNAKYTICVTKMASLFSLKCKTVPIYFCKKYKHLNEKEILLAYVRNINPKNMIL